MISFFHSVNGRLIITLQILGTVEKKLSNSVGSSDVSAFQKITLKWWKKLVFTFWFLKKFFFLVRQWVKKPLFSALFLDLPIRILFKWFICFRWEYMMLLDLIYWSLLFLLFILRYCGFKKSFYLFLFRNFSLLISYQMVSLFAGHLDCYSSRCLVRFEGWYE